MKGLTGKVAVITGGGTGIGAAIAARLIAEGGKVVIAGKRDDVLQAAAANLGGPQVVRGCPTDVTQFDQVERLVQFTVEAFGRLDILVNNAGVGSLGRVTQMDPAAWRHVFAVDIDAMFYTCRSAMPFLIEAKGAIVNISSLSGMAGDYGFSAYNAAKGAILNFTRALALDHARDGIRVNSVCPGLVHTDATQQFPAAALEQWIASIPMGRAGQPDEIAATVAFLASEEAPYLTGQNFAVDGGKSAHTGQPNFLAEFGR